MKKDSFIKIKGFDWDKANKYKSLEKHKVEFKECEQVFFNKPIFISKDIKHSKREKRFRCLGKTHNNRLLFISFTFRNNQIRVISARSQSKKERRKYEKTKKT